MVRWSGNYQFVNRAEREEIVRLFNGGESSTHRLKPCTPKQLETTMSKLIPSINQRWSGTVWFFLSRQFKFRYTWVGKIPTKDGFIWTWRNGNNFGAYNYAVYQEDTKEFFFRKDNKEVMDLLEMLMCEGRQLPGFMAREMCLTNQRTLEHLLRRE
jgi:hypothetical protein